MSRAGVLGRLGSTWRKNAPDVLGAWNGALPEFVLARRPREPLAGVPVFSFHVVEADTFAADLEFLRRNGYHAASGRELLAHLAGRMPLPARSVVLTFDDGPRNFHDVAFPLLRRYGAHAIAFVAPGLHGDDDAEPGARPMSWRELRAIHDSGLVEVQSHTLESRYVPRWPEPAPLAGCPSALETRRRGTPRTLAEDLAASRALLESRLPGAHVDQLAFPMYDGSEAALAVARAAGFGACHWGLLPGRALNAAGASPLRIARLSDEYLRRLPGEGRASLAELLRARLQRARGGSRLRRELG